MPETFIGKRKVQENPIERHPQFASIEMAAVMIESQLSSIPDCPDFVKEKAAAFVESLRVWARGGVDQEIKEHEEEQLTEKAKADYDADADAKQAELAQRYADADTDHAKANPGMSTESE
jgi:hypothetical protein